jgi:hypothetical protein
MTLCKELISLWITCGFIGVLPPYSPFLNPIEELFNQWKQLIKRAQSTNENELYEAVHTASENISPENCRMYVQHILNSLCTYVCISFRRWQSCRYVSCVERTYMRQFVCLYYALLYYIRYVMYYCYLYL